jgi:hypothetical protein
VLSSAAASVHSLPFKSLHESIGSHRGGYTRLDQFRQHIHQILVNARVYHLGDEMGAKGALAHISIVEAAESMVHESERLIGTASVTGHSLAALVEAANQVRCYLLR